MTEGAKQKQQLDREIRDMISALTHRLADLQREGGSSHDDDHNDQAAADDDDDHGVRIITLAGSNVGATMRSELDAEFWKPSADRSHHQDDVSPGLQEHEPLSALVNSNFQAINNSLMLGGSYSTNDPGVHMDVSDGYNNNNNNNNNNSMEQHQAAYQKRGRKEGKKKAKETTSKSDHHSQGSDA